MGDQVGVFGGNHLLFLRPIELLQDSAASVFDLEDRDRLQEAEAGPLAFGRHGLSGHYAVVREHRIGEGHIQRLHLAAAEG